MDEKDGFLFLPSATGEGVLIKRSQIVGGRPNGPDAGSILYTQAGPSVPRPPLWHRFEVVI